MRHEKRRIPDHQGAITPPNRFEKRSLCRMIFLSMLGLNDLARQAGQGSSTWTCPQYRRVAYGIRKYLRANLPSASKRDILEHLIYDLGAILDPKPDTGLPILSRECDAPGDQGRDIEKALDHTRRGYSRNPFKPVASISHIDDIALAIACYLLRGYAAFFFRPRGDRDFNAAKVALNDFHQAYLLAWRLYHTSSYSHHKWPTDGLDPFLNSAQDYRTLDDIPGRSGYYIWYALVLSEIMRANIYRQVGYIKMADRHYRRAETRFNQLCQIMGGKDRLSLHPHFDRIVTPTLLHAFFEHSKTRFDLGYFLEALILQLTCISLLVDLWQHTAAHAPGSLRCNKLDTGAFESVTQFFESTIALKAINSTIVFLNTERTLPIYDRDAVAVRFNLVTHRPPIQPAAEYDIITPKACMPYIQYQHAKFACEVFARIGFILYLLRPRMIARRIWSPADIRQHKTITRNHERLLFDYFAFDRLWNQVNSEYKIASSHVGNYWRTLIGRSADVDQRLFQNDIDRKLALILRERIPKKQADGRPLTRAGFYDSVFTTTTQNFVNMATVPRRNRDVLMRRGYKHRRLKGDIRTKRVSEGILHPKQGPDDGTKPPNKLVVLRRWQSFNPKIPGRRGHRLRGGGYFLLWQGKGIVIDPGYDFIQNFYDEGFSLEDIDAVIITHSHPDHDDDFSSLTTLIKEWNEYHKKIGRIDKEKRIDIFLNESSHWKYASWLQASDVRIGRVISLPTLCWDKDSRQPSYGPFRGRGPRLDLRHPCPGGHKIKGSDPYHMIIETVPAWHDDVIGKTAAIGLKIHLFTSEGEKAGTIGYTGDTGAYGLEICKKRISENTWRIDRQFKGCDILVAHLGDIRIRELATVMDWYTANTINTHPFAQLYETWFSKEWIKHANDDDMRGRIKEFLNNAYTLDMIPTQALSAIIPSEKRPQEVHRWLNKYIKGSITSDDEFECDTAPEMLTKMFAGITNRNRRQNRPFKAYLKATEQLLNATSSKPIHQQALFLVSFLTAAAMLPWQYKYHLGIFGIYELFKAMVKSDEGFTRKNRVFVVGELPEELTSYRHMVAHWLNMADFNWTKAKSAAKMKAKTNTKRVHAFTGDIGLHIGLHVEHKHMEPRIRCTYCNYNNETVCRKENYQYPKDILETPIKRQRSALIYLCTKKDHHPACPDRPRHFLGSPYLRVI